MFIYGGTRSTKETVERLFLFLSFPSRIDCPKALKALGFPTKTGIQGLLCDLSAILIYLSLLSPISIPNVGRSVGTPPRSTKIISIRASFKDAIRHNSIALIFHFIRNHSQEIILKEIPSFFIGEITFIQICKHLNRDQVAFSNCFQ